VKKNFRGKLIVLAIAAWGLGAGASVLSVHAHADPSTTSSMSSVSANNGSSATTTVKANGSTSAQLDRTGRSRVGIASYYAKRYGGRKMADGTPFNLNGANAASLTLPLGTTARVTDLETGRSAEVVIRDRGPYVGGRIIDLSPGTAHAIGIDRKGLAKVKVTPLAMPLGNGTFLTAANSTSG